MKPTEAYKAVKALCQLALQRGLIADFPTAANVMACLDLLGKVAESAEQLQDCRPANGFLSPSHTQLHETDKRD